MQEVVSTSPICGLEGEIAKPGLAFLRYKRAKSVWIELSSSSSESQYGIPPRLDVPKRENVCTYFHAHALL
jgi:hypothetical protein